MTIMLVLLVTQRDRRGQSPHMVRSTRNNIMW